MLLTQIFITILVVASTLFIYIQSMEKQIQEQTESVKTHLFEEKKIAIKDLVDSIVQQIESDLYQADGFAEELTIEELKEYYTNRIRAISLSNDGYIWVNEILDYDGGEDYAFRRVHPNIPESEGMLLSTNLTDIDGNLPYLIELEGVKANGSLFFSYWFKKKGSTINSEKITYARLLKEFDWIIATGVYYDDMDLLVAERKAVLTEDMQKSIRIVFLFCLLFSVIAILIAIFIYKKIRSMLLGYHSAHEAYQAELKNYSNILEKRVKERTAEITEVKELYQDLYNNSPDIYFSVDYANGIIIRCNNQLIDSLPRDNFPVIGNSWLDLFYHTDHRKLIEASKVLMKEQKVYNIKAFMYHNESGLIPVQMNLRTISNEETDRPLFQATVQDISYLTKIEEQNRSLQKGIEESRSLEALGTLAGSIAHDFNNLLVPIMGFAELGTIDSSDPTTNQEYFNQILSISQKGSQITKQILLYSKHHTLLPKMTNINSIIKNFKKTLDFYVDPPKLLKLDLDKDLPQLSIDQTQFEQILLNLIINANDSIESSGTITISSTVQRYEQHNEYELPLSEYVVIEVSDTGRGIPSEYLSMIFDPLFTTKEFAKGTGLGLATCKRIMKEHQGNITVTSSPEKGTSFKLHFQVDPVDSLENVENLTSEELAKNYSFQGKHIVVVDDETSILDLLHSILSRYGGIVHTFSDPTQALTFVETQPELSLVISDILMPKMDGREMVLTIHELKPDLPALFMTGYANNHTIKIDSPIIYKPFSISDLIMKVHQILG